MSVHEFRLSLLKVCSDYGILERRNNLYFKNAGSAANTPALSRPNTVKECVTVITDSTIPDSNTQVNKPSKRPAIGEKCLITAEAYKSNTAANPDSDKKYPRLTRWHNTGKFGIPFHAYYIGYRVVHEGETYLEYDEDGYGQPFSYPVWRHTKSHVVWLFVESEKHSPIYVFPCDVVRQADTARAAGESGVE